MVRSGEVDKGKIKTTNLCIDIFIQRRYSYAIKLVMENHLRASFVYDV